MKKHKLLIASIFCICLVSVLNGQISLQTGSIRGVVTDSEGTPLPGVSIVAKSPSLQGTATDVTRVDGSFRLPALPVGVYSILAEL